MSHLILAFPLNSSAYWASEPGRRHRSLTAPIGMMGLAGAGDAALIVHCWWALPGMGSDAYRQWKVPAEQWQLSVSPGHGGIEDLDWRVLHPFGCLEVEVMTGIQKSPGERREKEENCTVFACLTFGIRVMGCVPAGGEAQVRAVRACCAVTAACLSPLPHRQLAAGGRMKENH